MAEMNDDLPAWLMASLDADPTLGQVGVVADWLDEHGHPLAPGWRWLWGNGRMPWGYYRERLWSNWTKDAEDLSELPEPVFRQLNGKRNTPMIGASWRSARVYKSFSAAHAAAARAVVRAWIEERVRCGKNTRDDSQIIEAQQWIAAVLAEQAAG